VIEDANGNLYGTTTTGGGINDEGVVYELSPTGQETVLYRFDYKNNGGVPYAGLTRDSAGNLYGTTTGGVTDFGSVFKIDPKGTETVLHKFTGGADGAAPFSGVILDNVGKLYGTTSLGGIGNEGLVFALKTN
jgi:uncharacterized repeat protein (TIGR03803 family)